MKSKKYLSYYKNLYLLAFFIPFIIMLVIFAIRQIFPFGDRSFLHIDMYHQYFPFLVEFYHKIKNGESLFYSWNTGIGSNFLALYVYYLASPTNWLCLLFPESALMEFISYMVIIKIGLCSVSFTYYLEKHFKTQRYAIVLFSCFYALSGYMAAYNWNVMWLDCIILAPIIILGLEKLVNEGNCTLYCITLALCILSNYYLSIMICIFLVLYFAVLLIGYDKTVDTNSAAINFPILYKVTNYYAKAIIRFAIYSLLAGGMAAILLFPEILALRFSEFSEFNFPKNIKTYFSVIDMIARHSYKVTVETGLDHWPNIYCGVAVFLLLPLYAMQKEIPIRQKAPKLILLGFMLISYSTNVLNWLWHGFNYPDSLPARQSFLYIFLLLVVCFEAFIHIKNHSSKEITGLFLGVMFFLLLCEKLITDDSFTSACFLFTGIFLICYGEIFHLYRAYGTSKKWIAIFTFLIVIIEVGTNTYYTSVPTVSRTSYWSNYDSYKTLVARTKENEGNDFFRFDKFSRRTQNDAMFVGFPSATCFSSTTNSIVNDFYEKYGMKSSRVNYCFDGATPFTAALLANRYMLYTDDIGYSDLFQLVDTQENLYLYKNNYSLPMGYMVPSSNVHPLPDFGAEKQKTGSADPLERQNDMLQDLGFEDEAFIYTYFDQNKGHGSVEIDEAGHYYAYTRNTKIDNIVMNADGSEKTFKAIKKKYILDLGYQEAGTTLSLSSENGEDLNIDLYRLNYDVLSQFMSMMYRQTMTVDSYTDKTLKGHINVNEAGSLVLSIPYEPGWKVLVDGKETEVKLFEDTFMSIDLPQGNHEISLSFYPTGLNSGILVSILSILLYTAIYIIRKKYRIKE